MPFSTVFSLFSPRFGDLPAGIVCRLDVDLMRLLGRFTTEYGLQLSPRRTGTDGFYLACLERRA